MLEHYSILRKGGQDNCDFEFVPEFAFVEGEEITMLRHMKSVREIDWTGRHRSANYSPVDIENYHRVSTWLCCSLCDLH